MPNAWTNHIKQWAKDNNMSYMCAMSQPACREAYKKPEKVKKTKKSKEPVKTSEPDKTSEEKKQKMEDEIKKIEEKIKKDFIPAIKDVFFYIKKILFSKKPPTQEKFEEEISKIIKKNQIDYGNIYFGDEFQIKKIYDFYNEKVKKGEYKKDDEQDQDDAGSLMWDIWNECLESEFYDYWATRTDFVNSYRDTKGLKLLDKGEIATDDEEGNDIVNDAFYEIYGKIFTYEWFLKNIKK